MISELAYQRCLLSQHHKTPDNDRLSVISKTRPGEKFGLAHFDVPIETPADIQGARDAFLRRLSDAGVEQRQISRALFGACRQGLLAGLATNRNSPIDVDPRIEALNYDLAYMQGAFATMVDTRNRGLLQVLFILSHRRDAIRRVLACPEGTSGLMSPAVQAWRRRMDAMFEIIESCDAEVLNRYTPRFDAAPPRCLPTIRRDVEPPVAVPMTDAERFIYYAVADALDFGAYDRGWAPNRMVVWVTTHIRAHLSETEWRTFRRLVAHAYAEPDAIPTTLEPKQQLEWLHAVHRRMSQPLGVHAFAARVVSALLRNHPRLKHHGFFTDPVSVEETRVMDAFEGLTIHFSCVYRSMKTSPDHSFWHAGVIANGQHVHFGIGVDAERDTIHAMLQRACPRLMGPSKARRVRSVWAGTLATMNPNPRSLPFCDVRDWPGDAIAPLPGLSDVLPLYMTWRAAPRAPAAIRDAYDPLRFGDAMMALGEHSLSWGRDALDARRAAVVANAERDSLDDDGFHIALVSYDENYQSKRIRAVAFASRRVAQCLSVIPEDIQHGDYSFYEESTDTTTWRLSFADDAAELLAMDAHGAVYTIV